MTPGFGVEHPGLAAALAGREPVLVEEACWGEGIRLRISLYEGEADLPDALVSSVRCLTRCGDEVLVCTDAGNEGHVLPGGRREPHETWVETAVREVHEETGWQLDATSVRWVAFLHFRHLDPMPASHPFPHPDFLQVVFAGTGTPGPPEWVDADDGYVSRSWAVPLAGLDALPLGAIDRAVLQLAS